MSAEQSEKTTLPPQHQDKQPGRSRKMHPQPQAFMESYKAAGKLEGKIAVVTGGDSGIGRAVCIGFAKEGADVAIIYLDEHDDARETARHVEAAGRRALLIAGDIGDSAFCNDAVAKAMREFGRIDILVNNAGEQHVEKDFEDIDDEQLERTFRTNIFGPFHMTRAALPHMKQGAAIVNTASITAYKGNPRLIDYSATKGAMVAFTRSLSTALMERGIRVNAVAPGPIWTPLIPSSFSSEQVAHFGASSEMERPGQPDEVAPSYIFLASADANYMSGQVMHPNGGTVVGG
jgi:NAD(P)-dependent dehydrogenase (short-subunit alcohol dehydrogenase family)